MRALCVSAVLALAGACGVEADDRPARWSYIHPAIILPNCATAGCHSAFARTKGISLQEPAIARDLFVTETINIALLRGQDAQVPRMPRDQPLPAADIELIQRWIDDGMPDD